MHMSSFQHLKGETGTRKAGAKRNMKHSVFVLIIFRCGWLLNTHSWTLVYQRV